MEMIIRIVSKTYLELHQKVLSCLKVLLYSQTILLTYLADSLLTQMSYTIGKKTHNI